MSKYNKKTEPTVKATVTLQGGSGFNQRPEKELIGLLSVGLTNTFYEKEGEREKRFASVFAEVAKRDVEFAAKSLVYARTVFKQRTVTHYGAVELAKYLSGNSLGKRFFSKREKGKNSGGIVYRLDDMNEILACYFAKNGKEKPIPNAIKKGFKIAIENSDTYELAKYQMKGKEVSLVDIVNMVHPVETKVNGTVDVPKDEYLKAIEGTKFNRGIGSIGMYTDCGNGIVRITALHALVIGMLKQFNTVEDKNSDVGKEISQKVKSGIISSSQAAEQLNEMKGENYAELIASKKIGYIALLRNLRNIINLKNTAVLQQACDLLVNANFIRRSMVLPHQIDLALEVMLAENSGKVLSTVSNALNIAYELSVPNLADYFNEGRTAVILDVSGSMSHRAMIGPTSYSDSSALAKGALVAATLAKGIGADTYVFANRCLSMSYNPLDSIHTISKDMIERHPAVGGGTYWSTIYPVLMNNGRYDRIFIISDEQGADNVELTYREYIGKYGMCETYVINMCGYAPTMIKESSHVHRVYGYGPDIYETAKRCEVDINALIKDIKKINI